MRKNFFKKLSFVLALAMIVSVFAPAAGVFAASGLKLNSSNQTLHLAQPGKKSKFNFNLDGTKKSGWKYEWTSDNEEVATVNPKNGVTVAVGIGTANITVVIKDKKGKEIDRLTATVTVKDNIKELGIANVPDEAIKVDQEYDFDRTFVTYSGVTEKTGKTTAVTRWSVEGDNSGKASINPENGKFTASEAGKYTVVARAFQSKAKYYEWLETGNESLVLTDVSCEITVKASIKEVKQYDSKTLTVEFDSNMKEAGLTKDSATISKLVNGKEVSTGAEKIKSLALDESGKVATVEMYTDFIQEQKYKFAFDDLSDEFTAAKIDLSLVTEIEFSDVEVNIDDYNGKALLDYVVGKNADGVILYRGNSTTPGDFDTYVSFEVVKNDDVVKAFLDPVGKRVYIYENGYAVELTAKYEYTYFNTDAKKVETVTAVDTAVAKGAKLNNILINESIGYAIAKNEPSVTDSSKWSVGPFKLAADDQGYKVFLRYRTMDLAANSYSKNSDTSRFTFESTNADKLIIWGNDIYPAAAGTVTVLVHDTLNNGAVVGAFEVVISPARGMGGIALDPNYVVVSNNANFGTDGEVARITVTDNLGDLAEAGTYSATVTPLNGAPAVVTTDNLTGADAGKIAVLMNAKGITAANYQYKITVSYKGATREVVLNVQVKEANTTSTNKAVRWQLDVDKAEADLKGVNTEALADKTLKITMSGYNQNNVKVEEAPTANYAIDIRKDGVPVDAARISVSGTAVYLKYAAVSGSSLDLMDIGTYVITATVTAAGSAPTAFNRAANSVLGRTTFTLKDSTKTTFNVNPSQPSADVLTMVKAAFEFFVDDWKATNSTDVVRVVYVEGSGVKDTATENVTVDAGRSVLIKEVYVTYGTVTYKFTPNTVLTAR